MTQFKEKCGTRAGHSHYFSDCPASFGTVGNYDHLTFIELLCIHNYDVYTKLLSQDEFGSTPLVAACYENRPKVVTVLIENGAVVDSTDKVFQNSIVF